MVQLSTGDGSVVWQMLTDSGSSLGLALATDEQVTVYVISSGAADERWRGSISVYEVGSDREWQVRRCEKVAR